MDTDIQPWRPQYRTSYMSVEQLMTERRSRRILRIPLSPNAETRKSFELAVAEIVNNNIPDEDDDENILNFKNNQLHDQLYGLIADSTRRRDFPDLENLDSEADIEAALSQPNITPYDRRRLLRQRNRIQQGKGICKIVPSISPLPQANF
jgi:hypothetical protein